MSRSYIKAGLILKAIHNTLKVHGTSYTYSKADSFLSRVGAILERGPDQMINSSSIYREINNMFDDEHAILIMKELDKEIFFDENPEILL